MILIDSSSWIHWLRTDGSKPVRARVDAALQAGDAAWCAMVRLELWNGAGGAQEKKVLRDLGRLIPDLEISVEVWDLADKLAQKARTGGITVPATDMLIAACARHHGAELEHADSDFDHLDRLKT